MKEAERLRREHQEAREQIVVLRAEAAHGMRPLCVAGEPKGDRGEASAA